jgi:hypothetical protein
MPQGWGSSHLLDRYQIERQPRSKAPPSTVG